MEKILRNVIIFSGAILLIAIIAMVLVLVPHTSNNALNTASTLISNNAAAGNTAANSASNQANNVPASGEFQDVKLSVSGGTYILTPSVLKKGVPVRMTADLTTVRGCSRDVVISAFGVRKYVTEGNNLITFTPTQTGTINIACSMNMYRGTFTVVDSDTASASVNAQAANNVGSQGTAATTAVEAQPVGQASQSLGAPSCGMAAGGGCGCGG